MAATSETDPRPSNPHVRSWLSPERAEDALGIEWDLAQAHSECVEDRVGNRGRHWGRGRFAAADALVDRYLKMLGPLAQPHLLALTNQWQSLVC